MKFNRRMKRLCLINLVILSVTVGLGSCQHTAGSDQTESQALEEQPHHEGNPIMKFAVDTYDFGDIAPGETVSYTFTYTNEGDANLIILSAAAGCGCTVPKWKKDPLPPGKQGHVEVVFDSSGRSGKQIKNVTIRSNGDPSVKRLQIQANIIEPNS